MYEFFISFCWSSELWCMNYLYLLCKNVLLFYWVVSLRIIWSENEVKTFKNYLFFYFKKNWLFLARYYSEIRARQRNFGNLKIHHHPNDFFAPLLVLNRPTTQVAKYIYHTPFQYFFSIFVLTTLHHLPTFPIFFFLIMHNFYFWPHGSLIWHEILCSPWFGVKMVQRWKSLQGLQSIGSMMRVFISPTSIGAEREENVCT